MDYDDEEQSGSRVPSLRVGQVALDSIKKLTPVPRERIAQRFAPKGKNPCRSTHRKTKTQIPGQLNPETKGKKKILVVILTAILK